MRGRRQAESKKGFVNSYHVNEVPLPYYNPLADCYLRGYFANSQNQQRISLAGLAYHPQKNYNYEERKMTNFNKFLRSNSYQTPSSHLSPPSHQVKTRINQGSSSALEFMQDNEESPRFTKRMSERQFRGRNNEKDKDQLRLSFRQDGLRQSFSKDGLSQRPTTNNSSRRGAYSVEGRRQCLFKRSQRASRIMM